MTIEEAKKKAIEQEQQNRKDELLKIYQGEDRVILSVELDKEIKTQTKPKVIFNTHLSLLDSTLDGFREGNLVVVSGHTGDGKTAFCQDLTRTFAENKISSLWFTYEMGEEEFFERFGIELPVFYLPKKLKNSMNWFKERIREAILKYNTKVVFIDHLHFLTGMDDLSSKWNDLSIYLGLITQELKRIAVENQLIIFLIVHPRKVDNTVALGLDEVGRDSSFIVQNADTVMTIFRQKKRTKDGVVTENKLFLNILKNRRRGGLVNIPLSFVDGHYSEWTPENFTF